MGYARRESNPLPTALKAVALGCHQDVSRCGLSGHRSGAPVTDAKTGKSSADFKAVTRTIQQTSHYHPLPLSYGRKIAQWYPIRLARAILEPDSFGSGKS